jgi:hypothetical protein
MSKGNLAHVGEKERFLREVRLKVEPSWAFLLLRVSI